MKSGNNKILFYQDISTAFADAANDMSMPCHEQWTGAAIVDEQFNLRFNLRWNRLT